MTDVDMGQQDTGARPKIMWGQAALAARPQPLVEDPLHSAAPAAVDPLAAAAALLQEERQKHETRCVARSKKFRRATWRPSFVSN